MVKKAASLSTKGSLPSSGESRKASSDYKKTATGNQIKNIKASGTEDPQGKSNELSSGPKKDETTSTSKTLEENEIELDDSTLDEILKELESEVSQDQEVGEPTADTESLPVAGDEDEEINISELFEDDSADEEKAEDDEAQDDDKPWVKENLSLKKELKEYRDTVQYLRDRINEVNLLNAKLLYTNRLFKQANLTNEQKLKVIESFDLTKSVREAKLIYATLTESLNFGVRKAPVAPSNKKSSVVKTITEGLASKPVASTKPTKTEVLSEGAEMANRFKKLAGIRIK